MENKSIRKAPPSERKILKDILENYLQNQNHNELLHACKRFIDTGLFYKDDKAQKDLFLRMRLNALRDQGINKDEAISIMANADNIPESSMQTNIKRSTKSPLILDNTLEKFLDQVSSRKYVKPKTRTKKIGSFPDEI